MRPAIRSALLATAAFATLCIAPAAVAQSFYGSDRYAPPPPPPPPEGRVYLRDDGYVTVPDLHNSDGTYGYRNHTSRPDATPDDPNGYAHQAERDRHYDRLGAYDDDGYGPPPPRYAETYGYRTDSDAYAPRARYEDRYDGGYAPPPRYEAPRYDTAPRYDDTPRYAPAPTYVAPSGYRGW